MSNLRVCKTVWVIVSNGPKQEDEEYVDVTYGVYESDTSAGNAWDELNSDKNKQEGVEYYIEEVPMYLDYHLISE